MCPRHKALSERQHFLLAKARCRWESVYVGAAWGVKGSDDTGEIRRD